MALGDFYVEEDEASDEGPDDAAAAAAAAANDIPVGTPRVAREALAAVRREARAVGRAMYAEYGGAGLLAVSGVLRAARAAASQLAADRYPPSVAGELARSVAAAMVAAADGCWWLLHPVARHSSPSSEGAPVRFLSW